MPPLSDSSIEPMPPSTDERLENLDPNMDPLQWYMYTALQHNDTYSADYLSRADNDVHVGDIIEPKFNAPQVNPPDAEPKEWVLRWEMVCLLCPLAADGQQRNRDLDTGYPFCDREMLTLAPARSYSESVLDDDGIERWTLKVPEPTVLGADDLAACTIEQVLNPGHIQKTILDVENPRVISQIFIVSRAPREGSYYRYNEDHPWGVVDDSIQGPSLSISSPTPTPTRDVLGWLAPFSTSSSAYSTPTYSVSSSGGSTGNSHEDSLQGAVKVGVGVGITIIALCFIIFLGFCIRGRKKMEESSPNTSNPRSHLPTAAAGGRGAAGEQTYVDRFRNEALSHLHVTPQPSAQHHQSVSITQQRAPAEQAYVDRFRTEALARTHDRIHPSDAQRGTYEMVHSSLTTAPAPQDDDQDVPPAYHKVVTNLERMEIERNMHRGEAPQHRWPPTYLDAQNAAAPSASGSSPVAPSPAPGSAPYPALPSSPPR